MKHFTDIQKQELIEFLGQWLSEHSVYGIPKLLTLEEIAHILQFEIKTVKNWAYSQKIPGQQKVFGEYRVNPLTFKKAFLL